MEQIAPLARILAEANGIEWQQLRGSGPGGTVVEQDILNYLSRIMSGEEEPPSTPVDEMPEGWTGDEQLPAGMFSADMLSQAGIDSDIADFVTQSRAPEAPTAPDSMDFELDDDMADLDAPLAAEPEPLATDWSFGPAPTHAAHSPEIQVPEIQVPEIQNIPPAAPAFPSLSAREPVAAPVMHASEVPTPEVAVPEVHVPEVQMPAASAPADVAAGGGLSGLLSRLYRKDKGAEAAPAASVPAPLSEAQPTPTFAPPSSPAAELSAPEFGVQTPAAHAPAAQTPADEVAAAEPQMEPEVYAAEVAAPDIQAPEREAPALADDVAPAVVAGYETAPQPAAEREAQQPQVQQPDAQQPAIQQPAAQQAAAQPVAASVSTDLPASAVWFGTYLRRDARVAAADDLRAQLSDALGQDVPLAFLVARAAQRHAAVLGLDLGHVALQGADGQDQPVKAGALRDALSALHGAGASAPDLLVTDAGTLGVDDLHYPHTLTLSLGRVQEGRAALSLNGDVDPRQAAQFLTRVAESLEKPIALVL